jgi:hypothetical protein
VCFRLAVFIEVLACCNELKLDGNDMALKSLMNVYSNRLVNRYQLTRRHISEDLKLVDFFCFISTIHGCESSVVKLCLYYECTVNGLSS